jgi:LmbE family N-acetylglucosaminyl deacetylase
VTTVVAFNAHPDDEVLLTGGTLAAAAAAGHRVVLVTATSGEAGLSDRDSAALRAAREAELRRSAAILGCAEVVMLGHPDSGMGAENRDGFAHLSLEDLAAELRSIVDDQGATVLLSYDRNGGYGHPDHVQVHRVARNVAKELPSVRLLEATIDRRALQRALRLGRIAGLPSESLPTDSLMWAFSDPGDIAFRARVGRFCDTKRRAMLAHRTQAVGGESQRILDFFGKLPRPLFRMVFRTEWFVDARRADDVPLPGVLTRFHGRDSGHSSSGWRSPDSPSARMR